MLDEKLPTTLYYQLREEMIKKIENKEWEIDKKIPTERELCDMYNVSRITVRKALDDLERRGYIYRKQGRGTFVRMPAIEQKLTKFYSFSEGLKEMGYNTSAKILEFKILDAVGEIAKYLNIKDGSKVYSIKRLRFTDGDTFALETSYIPRELCPGLTADDVLQHGLYNALKIKFGIIPNEAIETFEAIIIGREIASELGIKSNQPGLRLERFTKAKGVMVEYCDSIIRGDRFKYKVELK